MGFPPQGNSGAASNIIIGAADVKINTNPTEQTLAATDYTKYKETRLDSIPPATIRIKFDLKSGTPAQNAYGKLYRNGTAIGTEQSEATGAWVTFSEDISGFKPGDLLQLWTKKAGSGSCQYRNFRLYHEVNQSQTGEFVNIL